jgi:tetratricopeptide (TPR) repeat protein
LNDIGWGYVSISEFDLAKIFYDKSLSLQPDNLGTLSAIANFHMLQGDYDEYHQVIQKMQRIRYDNYGLMDEGRYHMLKGNYLEAEKYYSQYFSLPKEKVNQEERHAYAFVLRKLGREKEAIRQINEAKIFIEKFYLENSEYDLAKVYSFLGEKKKALDYLSKWKPTAGLYYYVEIDPLFENIRNEPEFKRQVKRIQAEFDEMKKQVHARIKSGEFPSPEMIVQ